MKKWIICLLGVCLLSTLTFGQVTPQQGCEALAESDCHSECRWAGALCNTTSVDCDVSQRGYCDCSWSCWPSLNGDVLTSEDLENCDETGCADVPECKEESTSDWLNFLLHSAAKE